VHRGLGRILRRLLARARAGSREVVLEPDGYTLVAAMGIAVPRHVMARDAGAAARVDLGLFTGPRVVVKLISPDVLHRSDLGGVAFVPRDRGAVVEAVERMQARFEGREILGFTINQFIDHDASLGGELLLGARWTDDFGPVVTLGPGGIYAEFLSANLKTGRETAILSPSLTRPDRIDQVLESKAIVPLITGRLRGQAPRIALESLTDLVTRFMEVASSIMPDGATEFEINPLVLTPDGPVALDVLLKVGSPLPPAGPPRPIEKIRNLLEPKSVGIIGVSEKLNPGHMILINMLRAGYDPGRIHVVKPGLDSIEGCRCWPDLASLPGSVDLLILSVGAAQVPEILERTLAWRKAESLIVIPGGMSETQGGRAIEEKIRASLAASRATNWHGPVINGGNCLGIRSKPGRYDTMFIPGFKLPAASGPVSPVAFLSQSGAFAIARASKLAALNPRYLISLGNQTDLTVGDYLTWLARDEAVDVFACYVEGFRPLDGHRLLEAASAITASGRVVILYRAGRTPAGARASSSHTASIAGDAAVTRELARTAGVVVAETLEDFEDLVRLFCLLHGKPVGGWGLGALSNAGFECVAMADNVGPFRLPAFGPRTRARLRALMERCRLGSIVDVHNPLDVTPIMDDAAFEEAIRAVMDDERVDVGVIGCVPLTGALETLPASPAYPEDLSRDGSVVSRMIRLGREARKPWVAVVDAGPQYDPMAVALEMNGVATFRSADRAMRMLEAFCANRLHPDHGRLAAPDADRRPALAGIR